MIDFIQELETDNGIYKEIIHRGLFVGNNGIQINADVNGAYQIMKKVIPNAFANGIEGVGLHQLTIKKLIA